MSEAGRNSWSVKVVVVSLQGIPGLVDSHGRLGQQVGMAGCCGSLWIQHITGGTGDAEWRTDQSGWPNE